MKTKPVHYVSVILQIMLLHIYLMTGRMSASMTNTKLEVQDMLPDTKDAGVCGKVTIYLDAPKTVYTLGLVPGECVTGHAEMKFLNTG